MTKPTPEKLIALTGATGFVGGMILKEALERGHKVKALTRRPVFETPGVEWVKGDLENRAALAELFEGADAFIHTAGLVKARTREDFFAVNAGAVETILELGQKANTGKEFHFVLISSLAARHPELSHYAASKRGGEEVLEKAAGALPWSIIRPPAVYGPGDKEILKLFKTMKKGFAPVAGDDDNRFSLIHAGDLAAAIISTVHHKPAFGQTLEPDDKKQEGYTIEEVAQTASLIMERKIRTVEIPGPVLTLFAAANELVARFGSEPAILSRQKVREMTHPNWVSDQGTHSHIPHWQPAINIEKGFRETLQWYQTQKLL